MTAGAPEVSLVLPVYNGAAFAARSVRTAAELLASRFPSWEVVVVDDGSLDGTAAAVGSVTCEGVRLVRLATNTGKFGALKAGMREDRGRCRAFTDADLPFDLSAIPYMARLVNERGFHLVIGDRMLAAIARLKGNWEAGRYLSADLATIARQAYWNPP